jgi:hypothetical protein
MERPKRSSAIKNPGKYTFNIYDQFHQNYNLNWTGCEGEKQTSRRFFIPNQPGKPAGSLSGQRVPPNATGLAVNQEQMGLTLEMIAGNPYRHQDQPKRLDKQIRRIYV